MQPHPYQPQTDPTAVMGRRIGAWVIDSAISFVVFIIVFRSILNKIELPDSDAAAVLCDVVNNDSSNICLNIGSTVYAGDGGEVATIWLAMLAYFFIFQVVLPSISGFTPGKGMVGLRIVKQDTFEIARFGSNLVRWLLWIVDSAPFILPLVGFVTGLASKGHRRVGDMVASTLVVDKKSVGSPVSVAGVNVVAAPPPPPSTPPWVPPTFSAEPTMPEPPAPEPEPIDAPAEPAGFAAPGTTSPAPPVVDAVADDPPMAAPAPEPTPGVDAPQWDAARNTYIQWDPELREWMEWSEGQGRWIPISR